MRYLTLVLVLLVACDTTATTAPTTPQPIGGDGGVLGPNPGEFHLHRINTAMTYPDAEAACQGLGGELAQADTIVELEAMMQECLKMPYPPPYPAPTCWTNNWLDNGTFTNTFAIDAPGYFKPVSAASLDSWLFLPLCAVPN